MHEPFMYLSVPLPYATQQQMCKLNTGIKVLFDMLIFNFFFIRYNIC